MYQIMCYTRSADEALYYGPRLAYSMHLALREGEGVFIPLNHNSGVLFARATENEDGSLNPKSLRNPVITRTADGGFLISAVRIEGDGDEEKEPVQLYWTSRDLVIYDEVPEETAKELYEQIKQTEQNVAEENYNNQDIENIAGCIPGNIISISEQEAEYLKKKLLPPENTGVRLPEGVKAQCSEDIEKIKAVTTYSDGTSLERRVDWNTSGIDFTRKGNVKVKGRVHQEHFAFPIAYNRADPCVARWNGKYYFIATNDADNNHTLYIREADTLSGLVDAEEILLLDSVTYEGIGNLLWAPEFHEINGRLYIFHAATPGEFFSEESHIMTLKEGGNPANRDDWSAPRKILKKDGSELCEAEKTISLDMTCFEWEGEYYVIWSQRQFLPKDLGAWLYIAKLNPEEPWKLATEPVILSKPDYGWDNNHTFVDEGPFALMEGDRLFITFSGAAVDESYVVSYLVIEKGKDLLDRSNWRKNNYPILTARSVEGEYGTGHNAYVIDEDGLVWNTYHARPGAEGVRSSGIRRVHFDVDGCPMLDVVEEKDLKEEFASVEIEVEII